MLLNKTPDQSDPSTEPPFLEALGKLDPEMQLALAQVLLSLALDNEQFRACADGELITGLVEVELSLEENAAYEFDLEVEQTIDDKLADMAPEIKVALSRVLVGWALDDQEFLFGPDLQRIFDLAYLEEDFAYLLKGHADSFIRPTRHRGFGYCAAAPT